MLLSMLGSASCETDVEMVNAPEFKQKLVIAGFISPSDEISYFRVTSNRKLYGELNTEEPLGLISGSISDGLNEVALDTCRTGMMLNHEKMQISFGKSYKIKISNAGGLYAEAKCTVPSRRTFKIEADTFSVLREMDQFGPYPGDTYRSIDFRVSFTDIPGEENFYRIYGKIRGYSRTWDGTGYLVFNDDDVISDKGMDGKSIILRTEQNYSEYFSSPDSLFVKIYLFNTEKSYYLFHKSLKDYNDGENPFTEASPVFSNITGGFGIFTSYTVDSLVVRLK
ncbi:MAG: DUF4249 domain-containing protein [Bacteroidia bacterium]|nr:DUF4249 domain-containing protein [Bacteroidia bacterium]